jgi:ELWxxDGT repeat protein
MAPCFLPRAPSAASSGAATAPRREPCWSRTSSPGSGGSIPEYLVNLNGTVFFSADDGSSGRELWKSDGTEAGTVLVKDIVPGAGASQPHGLVPVGNHLFFRITLAGGETELWKTDGTEAGTARVAAVGPMTTAGGRPFWPSESQRGTALGISLLFAASDPSGGVELWRSDGTEAGTFRLKDIEPGAGSSEPMWFAAYNGKVYFGAYDSAGGRELWATDGTESGTARVDDLHPGVPSSDPAWLTVSGDALWFSGVSPLHGRELWKFIADAPPPPTAVVDRRVFYNNSAFDGRDPAGNAGDLSAVADDKVALLPGQAARFANVTSYAKGINGVMVHFFSMRPLQLGIEDFEFRAGTRGDPSTWAAAPVPSAVTLIPIPGPNALYAITWPDGALRNTWLHVTVKANTNTGLAQPDVFYFGNLIGESGDRLQGALAVGAADLALTRRAAARRAAFSAAPITSRVDFNRDGYVTASDVALCRANYRTRLPLTFTPVSTTATLQAAARTAIGFWPKKRQVLL